MKVSIVVPVYNVERWLARCLDSCLSQTFGDVEVICVNDGSTDGSLRILEQYQKLDSRIRIVNKENGGLSSARNAGVAAAEGEYVLFVDSDDYISSNAVERLYDNATRNNSDLVIFDYVIWNSDMNVAVFPVSSKIGKRYENTVFNAETFELDNYRYMAVMTWCKFYRREFIKDIRFWEDMVYEDVPYWAEVFTKAKRITYLPEAYYFYFSTRPGSIMAQKDERNFDVLKAFERFETSFKQAGLWEMYGKDVQLISITNYLNKINIVKPELKERMYNTFKELKLDIDYEYYYNEARFGAIDRYWLKSFELLNKSKDFNEFLILQNEVRNEQ